MGGGGGGGMKICGYFFGGHHKIGLVLAVQSMYFSVLNKIRQWA